VTRTETIPARAHKTRQPAVDKRARSEKPLLSQDKEALTISATSSSLRSNPTWRSSPTYVKGLST